MRILLFLSLTVLLSCGGSQTKKCFECGLSDEWERAEAEERERADTATPPEEKPATEPRRNDAATTDTAPLSPQESTKRPAKRPCGLRSTARNPDPCGSTAGQIGSPAAPLGEKGLGEKALEREPQDYESEWDRPDYCGTPGCGHEDEGKRPAPAP